MRRCIPCLPVRYLMMLRLYIRVTLLLSESLPIHCSTVGCMLWGREANNLIRHKHC